MCVFVAALALVTACTACVDSAPAGGEPSITATLVSPTQAAAATPAIVPTAHEPAGTNEVPDGCSAPYPTGPRTTDTVFCADPSSMQRASVTRIVDGDTFHAVVDGVEETIRIFGVDTPERGEACFGEATDELRLLVAAHGGQVLLVPDARNRDRYDRLLRYVYTPDGLSIDAVLIARGFAYAWTDDGALRDPLVALETEVRGQRAGCLWR